MYCFYRFFELRLKCKLKKTMYNIAGGVSSGVKYYAFCPKEKKELNIVRLTRDLQKDKIIIAIIDKNRSIVKFTLSRQLNICNYNIFLKDS